MPLKMRGKILPKPKETPPEVPSNETNSQLEPLETAIDKQIGDLVPQKSRREVISRISTKLYAEYFSGPIAHPRHLREYNDISPGRRTVSSLWPRRTQIIAGQWRAKNRVPIFRIVNLACC